MSQLWIWTSALSARDNILNISLHLRGGAGPPLRTREGGKNHGQPCRTPEKKVFNGMARLESRPRNRPRWGTFSKGFPPFPSFLRSSLFFGTKVTSRIYDLAVDQGNTRSFSIRRNDSGKAPVKHGLLLFRTRISPFSFSLLLLSQDISKKKKMSYPSISKLIKNFQFSPHFDDRFETAISR